MFPEFLPKDIAHPSDSKFENPGIIIVAPSRPAPTEPATTAKVVAQPSIPP